MGKCSSCGSTGIFLKTYSCGWCNKIFCKHCSRGYDLCEVWLGNVENGKPPNSMTIVACSLDCADRFNQKVLDYPAIANIETDIEQFERNVTQLWHKAILNAFMEAPYWNEERVETVKKAVSLRSEHQLTIRTWRQDEGKLVVGGLMDKFVERSRLAMAQNLERTGRPLDAAKGYEKLKMYDKARELREKDKQVVVKGSTVSFDLNRLLQQVKDGGIVAVYSCPRCGGKLKIDKNVSNDKLRICEHCGSAIGTMDLTDFLKTALS